MTIGIDGSRANKIERTGTEWYSFYIIEHLKKIIPSGEQVILYVPKPLTSDLKKLPPNWEERILRWPMNFLWTQLRLSIEILLHRPDVLYVSAHTIPVIHPAVISVIHDVGFLRQKKMYSQSYLGPKNFFLKHLLNLFVFFFTCGKFRATEYDYHRWSAGFAVKHASKIVTVSKFSQEELIFFFPKIKKRVTVIPNGVQRFLTPPAEKGILKKWGIKNNYLLYIGRLEEKKNVLSLIKVFSKLLARYQYNGQLVLVGSRGLNYNKISEEINRKGLGKEIIETGWLPQHHLQMLVDCAEVFVFPSFYEGFGVPVLQAMLARTPVVCNDIPSLREIAGPAAKFCDFTRESEAADEIYSVITMSAGEKKILLDAGEKQALLFNWQESAQLTWEQILCIGQKNKENY